MNDRIFIRAICLIYFIFMFGSILILCIKNEEFDKNEKYKKLIEDKYCLEKVGGLSHWSTGKDPKFYCYSKTGEVIQYDPPISYPYPTK